jgi:hypothetical protein
MRIEPPESVPSAASARPAVSAAAAARAAGRPAGIARVRHRPVVEVLRGDAVGELVEVRLPGVRPSCAFEEVDGGRAQDGDVVREHGRAVRRPHAGGVEEVLDGEPPPVGRQLGDEDPV